MLLRWNIFSLERAVEHRTVFVCDVILCWYGVELAAKQAHQGAVDVHVVGGGGDHGRVRGRRPGYNDSGKCEGGAEARSECWQQENSH